VLAEKCSKSTFLPHTLSAFQQARRGALHRSVFLGRAAIFGHEENHGLQDSSREGCTTGEGRDGREEPTVQLYTCLESEAIEEIRDFLEWGGGRLGGDQQFRICGFGSRGFHTRGCILLWLPAADLGVL
jgi:hypothetical protein